MSRTSNKNITPKEVISEDYIEGTVDLFDKVVNSTEDKEPIKSTLNYENVKSINYAARGFKSLEEAFNFIETPYFKGLGKEDQEEFINWLY